MMAEESPEISTAHALRGAVESSSEYVTRKQLSFEEPRFERLTSDVEAGAV
jgi:hypothetical protein